MSDPNPKTPKTGSYDNSKGLLENLRDALHGVLPQEGKVVEGGKSVDDAVNEAVSGVPGNTTDYGG
jgi:hypothetical protein